MKAIAIFAGILLAVAIMFATMGQPTYSDNSGASFGWTGGTIFDSWDYAAQQSTERVRIEEEQQTQRKRIEEQEATVRNRDFWQQFPLIVLALAALCAAVGASVFGVMWSRRPHNQTPRSITVNHYAPLPLRQYAAQLGIDDAEYTTVNGQWVVVDPVTMDRYQPPPRLARLPPPR